MDINVHPTGITIFVDSHAFVQYGCIYASYNNNTATSILNAIVHLHPDDNIAVCTNPLSPGDTIQIGAEKTVVVEPIGVGHKIACRRIESGATVVKYGAPIGSATQTISKGQHVHLHNLKSDYIPSHTRQEKHGETGSDDGNA